MIIGIIPARGGSKRIPQKNSKLFLGRPLISYTIKAATDAKIFDRIIVTTDSETIATVAREAGAEVPFMRPAELSDDITPTIPVLLHALDWLQDRNVRIDYFCLMYSNPFTNAENILRAFELLKDKKTASVIPVTTYAFPIFRSFKINKKGCIEFTFPEYVSYRTQDLPKAYYDVGQFYWCSGPRFFEKNAILQNDTIPFFVPRYLAQDLDTVEDWEMAEKLYSTFVA